MKIELTEVTETQKHLLFEVPPEAVAAEIQKVAQGYSRSARVPGFRQGKVPMTVVKQRYKDQILYDVANAMIPRLVDEALRERGLRPVATPDIKDVVLDEGQPLTFFAEFETVPPIEPGEYTGIALAKPPAILEVGAIDQVLEQLRQRAAKWHPVEDRTAAVGDAVLMDVTRTVKKDDAKPELMQNVSIELGAKGNPPGFDENLSGIAAGDTRTFSVTYPTEYEVLELAGVTVDYEVSVKGLRRKELAELTDEFAKEVSEVETLEALRDRIRHDLQHEAEHEAEHKVRHDLLQDLAGRMRTPVPAVLVDREIDRRLEEFVRRLMDQGMDPMKAGIDWQEFRERQKGPSEETVKSTLVLDEIARREGLAAAEEDVAAEVEKFAERTGRTAAAVRARLEKEGGFGPIESGIRREKTVAWLLEKAQVS